MDRAEQQTRRRDLDRQLLELADRYQALGERVAAESQTNPHLNPYDSITTALYGMARSLRQVLAHWTPEMRAAAAEAERRGDVEQFGEHGVSGDAP